MFQIMACRLNGAKPLPIISINDWLLPIGPLGTNFSEILIIIQNFPFTKMHLKISSAKWWPFLSKGGDELSTLYHATLWVEGWNVG